MPQPASLAEPTDLEVIEQVLSGARERFEVLVRRHNQRLFRAARAVTRSDEDAEDALQQAWIDIFRHLATFRGDAAFSTWATRIAVRQAISIAKRRPPIALVEGDEGDGAQQVPAPQEASSQAERGQLAALLTRSMDRLPQGNREVMVLRDVLELDTAETAACLGLSEEAVRVRLHRARAQMATELATVLGAQARTLYSFDGARCDRVTAAVMCNVLGHRPL